MTGFKDRLKDALSDFVEFDEGASEADNAAETVAKRQSKRVATVATVSAVSPDTSLTDPEMVATLEQAVARSTEPGYDQFRVLYAAMDAVPDERLRYDVALKALQASHQLGPDAVLASIEDRIRLLDDERTKFEKAHANETERSITATSRQIKTLGDTIAAKQAEIRELETRQAKLYESAKAAQAELDRSRTAFAVAFTSVHTSLDTERNRISSHLSGGK
jgi:chromosome segregation ATPase